MEKQTTVTVQNIKNPALTRQMTVNSANMNSRKWKIIDSPLVAEEQPKKKDVKAAVGKLPEVDNSFVNEANDDLGTFAQVSEEKPKKVKKAKNVTDNTDEAA